MALSYIDEVANKVRLALPPSARPDNNAQELYRLYALLVLVTGKETSLENVHDAWSTWMSSNDPDHPALRPFQQLDTNTQKEDQPYLDAIRRVAEEG